MAGLTGSGREELAGALVGERPSHVVLENVDGETCTDPTPRKAKALGVVLVLPNRAAGAATAEFTVQENITLPVAVSLLLDGPNPPVGGDAGHQALDRGPRCPPQ